MAMIEIEVTEEERAASLAKLRAFCRAEVERAVCSYEVWRIHEDFGASESEMVEDGESTARAHLENWAGEPFSNMTEERLTHDDGWGESFEVQGWRNGAGYAFYYYPAHRVYSWWEGVDQRLLDAGLHDIHLIAETRQEIRHEIRDTIPHAYPYA